MKKNTLYLFILLLITGLNTSCNYLDIVPDETATEKDAFANPRAALRYLYSCYGYLPQSNMVQSCMDFTGDETISPFAESYVKFAEGSYDSSNTIISYWNTLFQGIRQCYLLKENIHSVPKSRSLHGRSRLPDRLFPPPSDQMLRTEYFGERTSGT